MRMIGYITSGYPTIEKCVELVGHYVEAGCDMLEISLPLVNNMEAPFLSDLMRQSYAACPDYDRHLEGIRQIAQAYPQIAITLLLYNEVAVKIGAKKLADFCRHCGIHDVNSADLNDPKVLRVFGEYNINLAGLILYSFDDAQLESAKKTRGFIYVQAFPREGQPLRPGYETIERIIACLRSAGIDNPLYCGGGIRTPEDAKRLKSAGADGFFLGTPIIELYDNTEALVAAIRQFGQAVAE